MDGTTRIEDLTIFGTATIGKSHYIEEGVQIGFPYHAESGPARVGDHCQIQAGHAGRQ